MSQQIELRKEKAVVAWGGRSVTITFDDVKKHICQKATDQEVVVFLRMAQSLQLNPWAREIYDHRKTQGERPFAEIKQTMRFRRFSLRGRANIRGEWNLVCAAANALTMYRAEMA